MFEDKYMIEIFFFVQISLECVPSVYLYVFWPQLCLLDTFPLQQHHSSKTLNYQCLYRGETLDSLSNHALYSHRIKKKKCIDLQKNSIKSHIHDSLSQHTSHSPSLPYQWHIGRGLLLARSRLHFSRASHLEERGRVTMDNPGISLRSRVKTWYLVKPSELLKWPSAFLQPDKRGRLRGTVWWSSWY